MPHRTGQLPVADEVVAITGATGFVGRALLPQLVAAGWRARALTRQRGAGDDAAGRIAWQHIPDIGADVPLDGCAALVHLAARVHVMQERAADPLAEFRRANVAATERLARRAAAAGVRRLIFLSSVKVNGEETAPGRPFHADDAPAPEDAYGVSKHEAECALRRVAEETGLEVAIIRPPLVYGPGVGGNFLTMLNWLRRGLPLPLASVDNRRSLVAVDNLCDLILTCLAHPRAANETFLVSDGRDLSTPELLRLAGAAMGSPARLLPCPPAVLRGAATMLGRPGVARRLCGSLQVDIGKTRDVLGWHPPVGVEDGLRRIFAAGENA